MQRSFKTLLTILIFSGCECGGEGELTRLQGDLGAEPSPLIFDTVPLGISATATVALFNHGEAPIEVSALRLEGDGPSDFALEGAPSDLVLQASERVEVTVRYTPTASGAREAALQVESNDKDTPTLRVPILATRRQGPVLLVCIESQEVPLARRCARDLDLDFGAVPLGEYREAIVELRSEGTEPVSIEGLGLSIGSHPGFTLTATASGTLAPGEFARVPVRFAANAVGEAAGSIEVSSAAGPRTIALTARGVQAALCVTPQLLHLVAESVQEAGTGTVSVSNCGDVDLSLTDITVLGGDGAFSVSNPPTRPLPLAPVAGSRLQFGLRYAPQDSQQREARVRFTSDAGVAVVTVRGNVATCLLTVTPDRMSFRISDSTQQPLVIANQGTGDCLIRSISIVGNDEYVSFWLFFADPAPDQVLAPGQRLELPVAVQRINSPPAVWHRSAVRIVHGQTAPETIEVPLIIEPPVVGPCDVSADPGSIQFGAQAAGTERMLAVALGPKISSNPMICNITGVELLPGSDPAFTLVPPALGELRTPHRVFAQVRFRPTVAAGAVTATIRLRHDGPAGFVDVPVSGFADGPALCVTPTSIDLGATQAESEANVELVACGSRTVSITGLDWRVADAELSLEDAPALPLALAPGERRSVTLRYRPTDEAGDIAILEVRSDDPARPRVEVRFTGGPSIVTPEAGRFLYLLGGNRETGALLLGTLRRMALQGNLGVETYPQRPAGSPCVGCHSISPDGRYLAFVEEGTRLGKPGWRDLRVRDTQDGSELVFPTTIDLAPPSWRPDVNTDPPYQFVYPAKDDTLVIAGLFHGNLGPVAGTGVSGPDDMPSWGPDGTIAFVRNRRLHTIPEGGGAAVELPVPPDDGVSHVFPAYSGDGRWIAYSSGPSIDRRRVEVVAADGSGRGLLLPEINGPGITSSHPHWSPDGRFLSYSSQRPDGAGDWDVYFVTFDSASGAVGPVTAVPGLNDSGLQFNAQWGL
jgi:hypothetical protein